MPSDCLLPTVAPIYKAVSRVARRRGLLLICIGAKLLLSDDESVASVRSRRKVVAGNRLLLLSYEITQRAKMFTSVAMQR